VAGWLGDGDGEAGAPTVVLQAARTIVRIEMARMDRIERVIALVGPMCAALRSAAI